MVIIFLVVHICTMYTSESCRGTPIILAGIYVLFVSGSHTYTMASREGDGARLLSASLW